MNDTAAKPAPAEADRRYRRTVNAWSMYDWANSAFFTTIVAAVFPPFYRSLAKAGGLAEEDATAVWAYTTSASLIVVAVIGPVLGAISDRSGSKKFWLAVFTGVGVLGTGLMTFLGESAYGWASLCFILGSIGVSGATIFYDSLLPHVARSGDMDRVSAQGYALGYVGGGLLLVINVLMILYPQVFGIPDAGTAVRLTFLTVAVWWAVFSLPLLRHVPEPLPVGPSVQGLVLLAEGFREVRRTLARLRRYRQLFLFLLAFLIYNDGIGTIIRMATAYGDEIGIDRTDMILALIVTQFVGIPCTIAFGRLAPQLGTKPTILMGLGVYILITVAGYFMETAAGFYVLALLVGLVQGGTQALSRSLYASMVPRARTAEFFGFFSTGTKLAGIVGPVLFGLVGQATGGSRTSILAVIVFFLVGSALLLKVDVGEGQSLARREDELGELGGEP
jgi:UMF1 family MFS transporter